ncbi:hypothetical protein DICPUDRAFT_26752 [Dictyostelium purpureum]|uniref:Uncharacterized protein n=1 Tax=Dictyostelium purpureum TaxID=5786 RepID=F0Z954_DICPU|nr:uncharacterized protein DICPUDRAFT_26752 [Dictyostelium purpureum]EGC39495.1 hypothetical protein DICPUDRAFT_26752 [Dictyostelium purpureum]|eukprot:XP_003283942.1 hypothetical protein DICPUDRAFT_26752 [Dictyostelium purpureum]
MSSPIKVNLVNIRGTVLKEGNFNLVNGKLPINQICKQFQIKDLVWWMDADIQEKLTIDTNTGVSEMSFANMKNINVTGTYL